MPARSDPAPSLDVDAPSKLFASFEHLDMGSNRLSVNSENRLVPHDNSMFGSTAFTPYTYLSSLE